MLSIKRRLPVNLECAFCRCVRVETLPASVEDTDVSFDPVTTLTEAGDCGVV